MNMDYNELADLIFPNAKEIQYKLAAFSGILTQFAWGGMLIMLYTSFLNNGSANTYTIPQMCTYIWLHQAFLLIFSFSSVDKDVIEMCRTGGISIELVKPVSLYYIWHAKTLGKKIAAVSLRALPIFVICAMPFFNQYRLTAPVNFGAFILFLIIYLVFQPFFFFFCQITLLQQIRSSLISTED